MRPVERVRGVTVARVHAKLRLGRCAKYRPKHTYVNAIRVTGDAAVAEHRSVRSASQRLEVGCEARAVSIRKIQSQRHVLCAGRGRQTKADIVDQSPVRRRS